MDYGLTSALKIPRAITQTDRLMKSFRDTEGDLKELAKALVT